MSVLQEIIDLHKRHYESVEDEVWGLNPKCEECHQLYPCPTRKIAEKGIYEELK